jgi:ketosteroid isomerase-like protein
MRPNGERLREMYVRFWEEGDLAAGRDVLADDVEWIGTNDEGLGSVRGRAKVGALFQEWLEAWEASSNPFELEEIAPDLFLVSSHFHARGRTSGIEMEMYLGQVYEFEDGMVVRHTMFRTYEEAREFADRLAQADAG